MEKQQGYVDADLENIPIGYGDDYAKQSTFYYGEASPSNQYSLYLAWDGPASIFGNN